MTPIIIIIIIRTRTRTRTMIKLIYLPTCSSLRITFTSSCKMACDLEESELTPVAPVLRTPPPYSITCKEATSSVIKTGVKIYNDLGDDFSS